MTEVGMNEIVFDDKGNIYPYEVISEDVINNCGVINGRV